MCEAFDGCVFTPMKHGGYSYHRSASGPAGSRVYWTDGRPDALVVLPGQACELLGTEGAAVLAATLDLSVTRVDVAWDCEGITPSRALESFRDGQVVTRAHRESWGWRESATGTTFTLGSRASTRFVRFYDQRGPTRIELEVKGDRAPLFWAHLMAHTSEDWSRAAMAHLRDFLDYRDREASTRPSDCPLLPWWAEVVKGASRVALPLPRIVRTLEGVQRWLQRFVAPMLAVAASATADPAGYLEGLTRHGRQRWRRPHYALSSTALLTMAPPA